MAEPKTRPNNSDVEAFLAQVEPAKKRADSRVILDLMREITGEAPEMWGPTIIGFGRYIMTYANGKTNEWMITGFSPRKQALTLYVLTGTDGEEENLGRLGKHKTGKSCLYIKKLEDVDFDVLKTIVSDSVAHMKATNPLPESKT